MSFSTNGKYFFRITMGLDNRQLSKKLGGFSETVISRALNSDKPPKSFLRAVEQYLPEVDLKTLLAKESIIKNEAPTNRSRSFELIAEIRSRMNELEEILTRE